MSRNKSQKIAETKSFPNLLEFPSDIRGKWNTHQFHQEAPIVLELGCGKGEYTVALARQFPDKNYIGVDIKGDRMWRGAKICIDEGISNAAFLRIYTEYLADYFAPGELSEIWITFPDPFPKPSKAKRRMISSRFLTIYETILQPGGFVHLKTDNSDYFEFGLETIQAAEKWEIIHKTRDLYQSPLLDNMTGIQTYYEAKWLEEGKTIKYGQFQLQSS